MSTSQFISVIHIAQVPKDGIQVCFRCGLELSRYPLMFWDTGHQIAQMIDNVTGEPNGGWADLDATECAGRDPEDIDCVGDG
jgi:hypothetical protein